MYPTHMIDNNILRDLGDGLLLRHAAPADIEALVHLQTVAFNRESETVLRRLAGWTRDLMSGRHPTFRPGDFTVVEDTRSGAIVSSLNLISQRWTYAGIEFGVGRPEIVCTLPEYRDRGLVRAQFETIHRWSAERGELVQAITGIPYYYRQFGYELAMNLGGSRWGSWSQIPEAKGEDAWRVRPATEADVPFIVETLGHGQRRWLMAEQRDATQWSWELTGISEANMQRMVFCVIDSATGEKAGCLVHPSGLWQRMQPIERWELLPGISWLAVALVVLRYLRQAGAEHAALEGKTCDGYALSLGAEHPAYAAMRDWLPGHATPYAWYLRVPDLPAFLRRIAPALEQRLADSPAAGHSGELKISFYRFGVRLVFEGGCLRSIEPWQPTPADGGHAAFPGLTFLQLLFGYRTLEEVRYAFADCWVEGDGPRLLLEMLFPKQPSHVWPLS